MEKFRAFRRDKDGTVLVEFVIVFPLLLIVMTMGFEFFDAYKSRSRADKVTASIARYIELQEEVTDDLATNVRGIMDRMLPWLNREKSVRITQVINQGANVMRVAWSVQEGDVFTPFTTGVQIPTELAERIGGVAVGDYVVIIETEVQHRPMIDYFDLSDVRFNTVKAVRPRSKRYLPPRIDLITS